LLSLKNATGSSWPGLTGWDGMGAAPCASPVWQRIVCNDTKVVSLDLSGYNLQVRDLCCHVAACCRYIHVRQRH
jgi:hypothetical protein